MARLLISTGSPFEDRHAYSRAVVQGDWCFVAGTTGFDYATMTISESLAEQTEQCLRNIQSALGQAGATLDDVVRVMYVVPNGSTFRECWPILRKYFGAIRPAATVPLWEVEIVSTAIRQPRK